MVVQREIFNLGVEALSKHNDGYVQRGLVERLNKLSVSNQPDKLTEEDRKFIQEVLSAIHIN